MSRLPPTVDSVVLDPRGVLWQAAGVDVRQAGRAGLPRDGGRLLLHRCSVLGVGITVADYARVTALVVELAHAQAPLAVSALAVHGVMCGALDRTHRQRLNALDVLTPDGQPVRWALNWLHGAGLRERVYGPTLMLHICEAAVREHLPVFLLGGSESTVTTLAWRLQARMPELRIAGTRASAFRRGTESEARALAAQVRAAGARIVFVGLGCPRQEVFLHDMRALLGMPVIAVGAAFPFHAGEARQAPPWMQRHGLEWLHRLCKEPRRLWRRYLLLNPLYILMLCLQALGWRKRLGEPLPVDVAPQWWL